MKCFYHSSDHDGHCSGAIVKLNNPECELIPYSYGRDYDWTKIQLQETVYIVDCTLPTEVMKEYKYKANLIWIDHHKSTIEDSFNFGFDDIEGVRVIGQAGCELTWRYFHEANDPTAVHLLGRYDVFDLDADQRILPFHYGLQAYATDPRKNLDLWADILTDSSETIPTIIKEGAIIKRYVASSNAYLCRSSAFSTTVMGHKALCVNSPFRGSLQFESIWDPDKYDLMLIFSWNPKRMTWSGSLYTDKEDIDVSKIAKQHNGGGHAGAAGFSVLSLSDIIDLDQCNG